MDIRTFSMNGSMSVSDPSIRGGQVLIVTSHAVERWIERFNKDTDALCYRALNARRVPTREAKKFKNETAVRKTYESGLRFYEHGQVMFLIDDREGKKPSVVTVMPSSMLKGE